MIQNILTCSQGVESERCASFSEALKAGKPVRTDVSSTIADGRSLKHAIYCQHCIDVLSCSYTFRYDLYMYKTFNTFSGLAVPTVGVNAFVTAKDLVDKMVIVK